MNDIYEALILGGPSFPNANVDMDNFNAHQEWLMGGSDLIPFDLNNLLTITPSTPDGWVLELKTQPGLRAQFQESKDLLLWKDIGLPITTTSFLESLTVAEVPDTPQRFFRILALAPISTDGDDLNSREEFLLGLSDTTPDSDGDGLRDDDEYRLSSTGVAGFDARNPDTNANGVLDGLDDYDGDFETNSTEIANGSAPTAPPDQTPDSEGEQKPVEVEIAGSYNSPDSGYPPIYFDLNKVNPENGTILETTQEQVADEAGQTEHNWFAQLDGRYAWTFSFLSPFDLLGISISLPYLSEHGLLIPDSQNVTVINNLGNPYFFLNIELFDTFSLLPVDIDFVHPATGEMNESRETSEGGYIAIRQDEETPVTKLKLHKLEGMASAELKLTFSSSKIKIWKDPGRTQAVTSDSTVFPADVDTELFLEGVEKSATAKDIEIGLKVKIGSTESPVVTAKATVVQSEFPIILRAFIPYKWTQPDVSPTTYTIAAEGDNRGLVLSDGPFSSVPFRVRQKIIITPYADLTTQTDIVDESIGDTAPLSRHYDKNVAVPVGERSGIHGYSLISGILPRDSGAPTLPVNKFEFKTRTSSRNITYRLEASGEDGALPWYVPGFAAPNIDWKYDIKVDCTDPAKPKVNAKGERDGFPAYEILVITSDGTIKEIYYWRPPVNVQVGFGPLTTPASVDETLEVP